MLITQELVSSCVCCKCGYAHRSEKQALQVTPGTPTRRSLENTQLAQWLQFRFLFFFFQLNSFIFNGPCLYCFYSHGTWCNRHRAENYTYFFNAMHNLGEVTRLEETPFLCFRCKGNVRCGNFTSLFCIECEWNALERRDARCCTCSAHFFLICMYVWHFFHCSKKSFTS